MGLKRSLLIGLSSALTMAACSSNLNNFLNDPSDSAIIGGTSVKAGDNIAKSVVGLMARNKATGEVEICSGSLLKNNLVVTAAHCASDADGELDIVVIFSTDMDLKKLNKDSYRRVDKKALTAWWGATGHEVTDTGDVALLHFLGDVPQGYEPALIATSASDINDGMEVVLAGYGVSKVDKKPIDSATYPDIINAVQIGTVACEDSMELKNCYEITMTGSGRLRQTSVNVANIKFSSSEFTVNQTQGKGACHGDSGGPAYVFKNDKYYLVGITSRADQDKFNDCSAFAVYSSVPFFKIWIDRASDKLNTSLTNPNLN